MQLQSNSCSPPGKGSYSRRGSGTHRQQWKWKIWYFAAFYIERKPVSILLGRSAFQENSRSIIKQETQMKNKGVRLFRGSKGTFVWGDLGQTEFILL